MAEEAAPALPENIMTEVRELVTDSYNYWKSNATADQVAIGEAEMEKFMTNSDPAFVEMAMKDMNDGFAAQQSDPAGRVNEQGYIAWMTYMQQKG